MTVHFGVTRQQLWTVGQELLVDGTAKTTNSEIHDHEEREYEYWVLQVMLAHTSGGEC